MDDRILRVVAPSLSFVDLCRRRASSWRWIHESDGVRLLEPRTTFGYDARIITELAIATPVWKRPA